MKFSNSLLLVSAAALSSVADAAHLPIVGQYMPRDGSRGIARRSNLYGAGSLTNQNDMQYKMNITLGGTPFVVMIDTGSSELWVAADDVPNAKDTGKKTGVQYAIGGASGPIKYADLTFAGYSVPQQAFFQASPSDANPAGQGVMGLGPWFMSNIYTALNNSNAKPPVDNLFSQNKTTPNYLTVLLGRSDDPDYQFPGDLTVGEIIDGYEDVQNQPKLPVSWAKHGGQHWSILLDADGFIGPDGQPIPAKTTVSSTKNKKQLTTMFDTGYTFPQVPSGIAKGIYSQIEGAKLQNISGLGNVWTMGCDKEVNMTLKFNGVSYHVHPLDATTPVQDLGLIGDYCIGNFQPIAAAAANSDIDAIMGMAFLRNVYLLVDYGDWTSNEGTTADPYVQLLSTSNDTAEMHEDFVQVRLNGVDSTSGQKILSADHSPDPDVQHVDSGVNKYFIIGAVVGGVALLVSIALCITCLCKRRGGAKALPFGNSSGRYQPLDEPAPAAATDMHAASYAQPASLSYQPEYQPTGYQTNQYQPNQYQANQYQPQSTQYQTAWDTHH